MSNTPRLKGARRNTLRCYSCGHRISAGARKVDLPGGQGSVCAFCTDRGVLAQRLPCGHLGVPGMTIAADSADLSNFQCPRCSPHLTSLTG